MQYLAQYGYLTGNSSLEQGLAKFQRYFGLAATGRVDQDTLRALHRPRCGLPDLPTDMTNLGTSPPVRTKRFLFHSDLLGLLEGRGYTTRPAVWAGRELSWRVTRYPPPALLSRPTVHSQLTAALRLWSNVTSLTFTRRNRGPADIEIRFERG